MDINYRLKMDINYIKTHGIYIIVSFVSLIGAFILLFTFNTKFWIYWILLIVMAWISVILCEIEDRHDKKIKVQYTPKIKTANCKFCTREGVVYFTLLEPSKNPEANQHIIAINEIMTRNFSDKVPIKISDDIYSCKECAERYNLTSKEDMKLLRDSIDHEKAITQFTKEKGD